MANAPAKSRKKPSPKAEVPHSPFKSPGDPNVRLTLTGMCSTAQDLEEDPSSATSQAVANGGTSVEEWHRLCPIGTLHGGNLLLCNHEWHEHNPRCWICKGATDDLDPFRRNCVDVEACAERSHARLTDDPRFERYRQYHEVAKIEQGLAPKERKPTADRPTSGRCEHCGEPTKGGKFVVGHDAKLKGILLKDGLEGSHEAVAELMARGPAWFKKPERFDPGVVRQADELIQSIPTHEFLAQRVAQRQEAAQ